MRTQLTLALLALATVNAHAQDDATTEEAQEIRRYTVEMIIFTYNENVSVGTEVFVADPPPEPAPEAVFGDDVLPAPEAIDDQPDIDTVEPYELVMLNDDELTMTETWSHLERLDVYEPVMHFGWTQPTQPDEETESRPLSSFATPPSGLDGELKLYLGRYLHLVVDLALDSGEVRQEYRTPTRPVEQVGSDTAFREASETMSDFGPQPIRYRIQEDRIFKSGDVRYFDHPKFGVLAKITRVEEEEPEDGLEEFLGDPELVGVVRQ